MFSKYDSTNPLKANLNDDRKDEDIEKLAKRVENLERENEDL